MAHRMLSEAEGYELLKKNGIPVPEFLVIRTRSEVAAAADSLGYPLVMKVISPQIVHKSDAGGVVTGILSAADAENAFDTISSKVKAHDPSAAISGFIIERQEKKGLEILVGGRIDPTFGKIITVGMGGTLVELIRDVSIRVLPGRACRYQCHDPGIAGISPDQGIPQRTGTRQGRAHCIDRISSTVFHGTY